MNRLSNSDVRLTLIIPPPRRLSSVLEVFPFYYDFSLAKKARTFTGPRLFRIMKDYTLYIVLLFTNVFFFGAGVMLDTFCF